MQKEIYCFTFISETSEFYYFDKNNEKLELINVKTILEQIGEIKDTETKIDDLFVPSNYLVSPFNNTEAFLKNEYFLTKSQEEIKTKILKAIDDKTAKIFSIEGKAGTGKTLLTYDIAKTLIERGYNVTIVHCALSNDGIDILKQNWNIKCLPLKGIEQIDADIFIFDESQRLSINQVNTFITTNKTLIFAHDVKQRLNRRNQAEEVVALIKKTARDDNHYEINTKIRQNKEIASFIRKFFQLARIREDEMKGESYKDISFYYVTDNNNAKIYIEYLKEQGWEHIYLTTSNYTSENLDSVHFGSMQSAHKAIGQEFNNVVVIITPDFYYDNHKLSYKSKSHYNPIETLFQAVSRTRKKLKFVIINNPEVYKACMKIIHRE